MRELSSPLYGYTVYLFRLRTGGNKFYLLVEMNKIRTLMKSNILVCAFIGIFIIAIAAYYGKVQMDGFMINPVGGFGARDTRAEYCGGCCRSGPQTCDPEYKCGNCLIK
jgi:hypothetical protein